MQKRLKLTVLSLLLILSFVFSLCGCSGNIWFDDGRSDDPLYHYIGEREDKRKVTFILELRKPTEELTTESWDIYPHSKTDGELIKSWEIPIYGNTLYESVVKYFEDNEENFTFSLSQHKFYMFHDCTLSGGETYNLETVYIAGDGVYANCANYQSLLGEDGVAGTEDDVKTVVLVYRGWLY